MRSRRIKIRKKLLSETLREHGVSCVWLKEERGQQHVCEERERGEKRERRREIFTRGVYKQEPRQEDVEVRNPRSWGDQSWEGRGAPCLCSFYPSCLGLWVACGQRLHLTIPTAQRRTCTWWGLDKWQLTPECFPSSAAPSLKFKEPSSAPRRVGFYEGACRLT